MPIQPRNFVFASDQDKSNMANMDHLDFCLDDGIALLRRIEWCARISHRSEEAQTADSWQRIIKAIVLEHGDWSVVEHASVSVDMLVDRGITHELVRHRLFSFTQESTRFVNYEKKMEPSFISPFNFHRVDPDEEILAAGKKDPNKMVEDLEKAAWYLNYRIKQLKSNIGQNGK